MVLFSPDEGVDEDVLSAAAVEVDGGVNSEEDEEDVFAGLAGL